MKKLTAILSTFITVWVFLAFGFAPTNAAAGEKAVVRVSAAISLKDALEALEKIYTAKNPNTKILYNFGSSGLLQKQIEEGAPIDLFISAGKRQMDELASEGLIVPATRSDLLSNELVLIVSREKKNSIRSFDDLVGKAQSFSIGAPEIVPAGKYGKQTLVSLKLWDKLEKRIVFADNVRQVLAYVDSGNVDAGLVYKSDTVVLKSGVIAAVAPRGSHAPIVYPMAIIKASRNFAPTEKFVEFLKTPEASKVFTRYMFISLDGKR
jgi:molybdate transport system substrate-binding protein